MRRIKLRHVLCCICFILLQTSLILVVGLLKNTEYVSADNAALDGIVKTEFGNEVGNAPVEYTVDSVVDTLFDDANVLNSEFLYNLDNSCDYVYIEFEEDGYAIFYKDTMEMLEYSPKGKLPYSDSTVKKYYGGPGIYLTKTNGHFIDEVSKEILKLSVSDANTYSKEIRTLTKNSSILRNADGLTVAFNYSSVNDNQIGADPETGLNITSQGGAPSYDDYSPIKIDDGTYISHPEYFTSSPRHGHNGGNTCAAVASQLLLSYHNYYTDRRIIDNRYLYGDEDKNKEQNPNFCIDPMTISPEILGTRGINEDGSDDSNSYFAYIVDKIPGNASYLAVKNGLDSILADRNEEIGDLIEYYTRVSTGPSFGIGSLSSDVVESIISGSDPEEGGAPVIVLMQNRLGGFDHYVVAYGYCNYTYPGSVNSYSGYITYFGWDSSQNNIWVNSLWCCAAIDLQIDHEHNYYEYGAIESDPSRTEYRCKACEHRTDEKPDPSDVYLYISNSGKTGSSWRIKIENLLDIPVTVYYNTKMCNLGDAAYWTGLTDINTVKLGGKGTTFVTISENALATSVTFSYIRNGVRHISYADQLKENGGIHVMYSHGNAYNYSYNGMMVNLVGKNGSKWLIDLTNNTGKARQFYYNSKMCYATDAVNWTGLSDISSTGTISGGETTRIEISENGIAPSITMSYVLDNRRYILYADTLDSAGTMSVGGNSKSYHSYEQNGMEVSIVGKSGGIWLIELTNKTGSGQTFYYNKKMCFEGDAKNWNLSDVSTVYLASEATTLKPLQISENAMATSIAISYMDGNYRKIFYAKDLDASGTMTAYYSDIDTTNPPAECITVGTMITLANGNQVPVENLTGNEMLLVWNLETGTYDIAPILFIDSDPIGHYEVIQLSFSDGTMVDVISEHGFWDVNLNEYVYLNEYAANYIGHSFLKQGEQGMTEVILVDVNITIEVTTAYSPVTYGHLCYYVNGMLSMPGGIDGLFNIFEVDGENMKYDEQSIAEDIEKYGLYTYEELNTLVPVTEEMFDAVNAQYLKVAVGKGMITVEQIGELVERYADLFV